VRLFALLLTFLILGVGGYFAGSLPFSRELIDIYWVSLTALGAFSALSTFFLGQGKQSLREADGVSSGFATAGSFSKVS